MPNRITTILDIDDKGFKNSLKTIGTAVGQADGLVNKFKAGGTAAFDTLKQNAGAFAVAGGAAIVAFGVKAVGAFTSVAKQAIDLSTATGLATEEASRWIGVGDDYQVTAEALATGLGKIGKTLDDTKWAKYGIATRDAGGQARSVNDILLDSFDMLSKITNKTEQATVGQKLFGKGYQSLTPILGHTREEYEKMLGSVEKGQVITEAEAKKAERMRLAQDQLNDAIKEVTLSVGQMAAGLSPLIEASSKTITQVVGIAEAADKATSKVGGLVGVFDALTVDRPDQIFAKMVDQMSSVVDDSKLTLDQLVKSYQDVGYGADVIAVKVQAWYDAHHLLNPALAETDVETRRLGDSASVLGEKEADAAAAAAHFKDVAAGSLADVQRNVDELQRKWDELHASIDNEKALIHYKQSVDDVKQANMDAWTITAKYGPGSPESIAAIEAARLKTLDLKDETVTLGEKIAGLPPEQVTDLLVQIDQGDLDNLAPTIQSKLDQHIFAVKAHLDSITIDGETHAAGSTNVHVTPTTSGGGTVRLTAATGGIARARPGGVDLTVAEAGVDEAIVPLDGKHGIGGPTVNVFVSGHVMTERDLVRAVTDGIIDAQNRGEIPASVLARS